MSSCMLNIDKQDVPPAGNLGVIGDGQAFVSVSFLDGTSIILPGFDAEALKGVRELIGTLTDLAEQLEKHLAEHPPMPDPEYGSEPDEVLL